MDLTNLIKAACFRPDRVESSDAWVGHIPYAAWLVQTIKPSIIVELGTFSGNSYLAFCQSVKENKLTTKCYAVDTWYGDEHGGFYGEEIYHALNEYHEKRYSNFSRLLRMTFDEASSYFAERSIDLLHIDGLHTYAAVKHDFETWLPKLSPHAIVILHDINVHERGFGVWRFWNELVKQYPFNFDFIHSNGLGVLQLSPGKGSFNLEWLQQDCEYRQLMRELFANLGQRTIENYRLQETERSLKIISNTAGKYLAETNDTRLVLAERDHQISTLSNELQAQKAESQAQKAELQAQKAELQAKETDLHTQKAEQQAELQAQLQAQKAELQIQLIEQKQVFQLKAEQEKQHLDEREQILQGLNSKLLEIYSSTAWKLILIMWKIRLFLAPKNSLRERFGRWLFNVFKKKTTITRHPIGTPESNTELYHKQPLNEQNWVVMATEHTLFVAHLIAVRLQEYGCNVKITTTTPTEYSSDYYVVICPQMFQSLPPGEKRISFQMEQSISSRWFTSDYFRILHESLVILDYSLINIENLDSKGIGYPQIYYLPIGAITNYVKKSSEFEKEYDILFYGDEKSSPRRLKMLAALQKEFNIKVVSEVFGTELQKLIQKAKFVINIHYYENALLEVPRIQECLSLGVPVISEAAQDQDDYPELTGAVRFFKQDSISSMLRTVKAALSEGISHKQVLSATQKSAQRFEFMFDRFLIGMGFLPPEHINKILLPSINNQAVLSLPETISRRRDFEHLNLKNFTIFDGFRKSQGWMGCAMSYAALSRKALEEGLDRLWVMEDDVLLPDDFNGKIKVVQEYLDLHEGEWDIFVGVLADLHPDAKVLKIETYKELEFITIDKMTSTVCNFYSKRALQLIKAWDPTNTNVVKNTIDRYLENQHDLRIVLVFPYIVGHREDIISTIWGFQNTQYNDMFAKSHAELKARISLFKAGKNL